MQRENRFLKKKYQREDKALTDKCNNATDIKEGEPEIRKQTEIAIPMDETSAAEKGRAPVQAKNKAMAEDGLETNDTENPQVMDLSAVVAMFQDIKNDIAGIKNQKCAEKLQEVEKEQKVASKEVRELYDQMEEYRIKNEILTGVVLKMNDEMNEVKNKVRALESNNMKRTVNLTNFFASADKYKAIDQIEKFLKSKLEIEVDIEDLYYIGKQEPKMLIITVETIKQKRQILQNKKKLKGLTNKKGDEYYIESQQSPETREWQKRQRFLMKKNEKATGANKMDMKMERNKLIINNEPYRKRVKEPDAKDILTMDTHTIESILVIEMHKGGVVEQDSSTFIGYTISAATVQQVQQAYLKLRLIYADARHIVSAYYLPGMDQHFVQDYCDYKEPGAGVKLLTFLQKQKLSYRAIFVI